MPTACCGKRSPPLSFAFRGGHGSEVILVDDETVAKALEIHESYHFYYFDSLMITSALECGRRYLISEDMTDGQIIKKNLVIRNIFTRSL
jgi:predicted nucleic acid-binding protein